MARAAQKRLRALGSQHDEEMTLYDEEAAEAEELSAENEEEAHTNGATPEEPGYLETENEEELRQIISNIDDVVEELLAVPEWKHNGKIVTVLLRTLTTYERTSFIKAMMKSGNDIVKVYPDLVILSARHPVTKNRIFHKNDRGMLDTKLGKATERIALRASELNGLTEEAVNAMRKNSASIR